jgi:RNA polymerase sigma-70 factor (ECF subfamily)
MIDQAVLFGVHRTSNAERWGVSEARFAVALERSIARAFPDAVPERSAVARHCASLHLEDLALACACEDGVDAAWQEFVARYRPLLYRAAAAIDPTGGGGELVDTLFGDLFGTTVREGRRQSLLRYFHGRSSLATWLRSVVAQRHVDRVRERRATEPLPDDESLASALALDPPQDPERPRLVAAIQAALAAALALLAPRDRLRLGCYYAQQMTLAQVGRLLGEHEATVSRGLARTRSAIRTAVESALRDGHRLQPAEIDECFRLLSDDPGTLDLAVLLGDFRKESPLVRSKKGTGT